MADEKKEDAHVVVEAAPAVSVTELLTLLRDQAIAATRREEESARREERLTALLDGAMRSSEDARAGSMTAAGVGSGPIAGPPADGRRPPVESVGPGPRLHEGISLQEFGTWETRVRAHARRARWDSLPIEEQTAALLALLDDYWTRTLQHGLDVATPNTCENLVAAFRKHLRGQRSVVLDRREFFMRQQEPGDVGLPARPQPAPPQPSTGFGRRPAALVQRRQRRQSFTGSTEPRHRHRPAQGPRQARRTGRSASQPGAQRPDVWSLWPPPALLW
ncbi:hypothetical protein FJT64_015580 [Amphibalanus amphitrite]|uniref:Uncharacterized protein n=1 Tax=Amphibalanus amphitrite TaxID=1232801 RepID=A0A6A4X6Q9_AMPAM|nr:hypothetical protein FJT64_015580 [Amphibalanus amphitrite]